MRSTRFFPGLYAFLVLIALLGGTNGCRKRTEPGAPQPARLRLDPDRAENWKAITFQDAHGRSWSNLLLNRTNSPSHIGFRARYTLTEPEFVVVEEAYAWRNTRLREWMSFRDFVTIADDCNLLHEVRPAGSSGWVVGILEESAENHPPHELFKHCGWLKIPGASGIPTLPSPISGGLIMLDAPDGDLAIGLRQSQLLNVSQQNFMLNLDAPDFENVLRGLAEKARVKIEESLLPVPIQRLPPKERAEIQTRLAATLRQMEAIPHRPTKWTGTLTLIGAPPLPVIIETSYSEPKDAKFGGRLFLIINRVDRKEQSVSFEGSLDDRPGPTMASRFWLNTANLKEQSREIIASRIAGSSSPLTSNYTLANCYVRFPDPKHMELSAHGVDLSTFTRNP